MICKIYEESGSDLNLRFINHLSLIACFKSWQKWATVTWAIIGTCWLELG